MKSKYEELIWTVLPCYSVHRLVYTIIVSRLIIYRHVCIMVPFTGFSVLYFFNINWQIKQSLTQPNTTIYANSVLSELALLSPSHWFRTLSPSKWFIFAWIGQKYLSMYFQWCLIYCAQWMVIEGWKGWRSVMGFIYNSSTRHFITQ